jgi:hypothetical protein
MFGVEVGERGVPFSAGHEAEPVGEAMVGKIEAVRHGKRRR